MVSVGHVYAASVLEGLALCSLDGDLAGQKMDLQAIFNAPQMNLNLFS